MFNFATNSDSLQYNKWRDSIFFEESQQRFPMLFQLPRFATQKNGQINPFSDNELLSKISDLETKIQVCGKNVVTCESNLVKEKNFASFQKQKNQKLKKVIAETRKNNKILKNQLLQNQRDNSNNNIHQNEMTKLKVSMDILRNENEDFDI